MDFSYQEHQEAISDVLDSARARGSSLTTNDVDEILPHVNPGEYTDNCVECDFALDDILHGVPRVAGPGLAIRKSEVLATMSRRAYRLGGQASYHLESRDFPAIKKRISMEKNGTCGMLMWDPLAPNTPGHVLNVVTTSAGPVYLDVHTKSMGTELSRELLSHKMNFHYFMTGTSSL